jgi:hypothetical protein
MFNKTAKINVIINISASVNWKNDFEELFLFGTIYATCFLAFDYNGIETIYYLSAQIMGLIISNLFNSSFFFS